MGNLHARWSLRFAAAQVAQKRYAHKTMSTAITAVGRRRLSSGVALSQVSSTGERIRKDRGATAIGCEWCAPRARNWCSKSVKMAERGGHGKAPPRYIIQREHPASWANHMYSSGEIDAESSFYYFLQVAHCDFISWCAELHRWAAMFLSK